MIYTFDKNQNLIGTYDEKEELTVANLNLKINKAATLDLEFPANKENVNSLKNVVFLAVPYPNNKQKLLFLRVMTRTDKEYTVEFDDFHRFQTNFKKAEIATSDADLVQFVGKRRLETISFGKGAFMFRIYDKLAQLRSYPEKKALILTKWILNGYEPDSKARIFRHEIQLRDEHLKKHIPLDTSDRVGHIFANLSGLWAYALQKVQFVNLNSSELERVKNYENSETIRKIFHRAKTDKKRFHFWDVLGYWDNVLVSQTLTYKAYKESKKKTAEKAVKTFVSTTYKSFGAEPDMLKEVFETANSELLKYRGLTLHQYAQLKVVDSFVQNESLVINHGIVPPDIHEKSFIEAHRAYFSVLDTVPEIIRQDVRNKRFENYTNRRLALEAESVF